MKWIKIERDETGCATNKCLDEIFSHAHLLFCKKYGETEYYPTLTEYNKYDVYEEIAYDPNYVAYSAIDEYKIKS